MTTLFFSPFASEGKDPALLGPEVEDDDGKPDMWHTRGGQERCYSWMNLVTAEESSVAKSKKKEERRRRREIRKSKERTRRFGSGVELETTVGENVGVMDRDDDFRPDLETMGMFRVE